MRRCISKELEGMKIDQDIPTSLPMLMFVYQLQEVAAQRQVDGMSARCRLHLVIEYLLGSAVIFHASRVWSALFSFQALGMQVPRLFALIGGWD